MPMHDPDRHRFFRLALVGRAHVEHLFPDRLVQHRGARGRADQGHAMLLQQRQNCFVLGRAPGQKQGQDMLFLDQFLGIFDRQLRV